MNKEKVSIIVIDMLTVFLLRKFPCVLGKNANIYRRRVLGTVKIYRILIQTYRILICPCIHIQFVLPLPTN